MSFSIKATQKELLQDFPEPYSDSDSDFDSEFGVPVVTSVLSHSETGADGGGDTCACETAATVRTW